MCEDHFTKDLQNLAENDDECISRADRSPTFLNLLSTQILISSWADINIWRGIS